MHQLMAATLDTRHRRDPAHPDGRARATASPTRPRWPMIVLRYAQGLDRAKVVDGLPVEGTFRAHQVPLAELATQSRAPEACSKMDAELPARGAVRRARAAARPELAELAPEGERRMGANPHANGGLLLRDLRLPDFRDYAVDVPQPGRGRGRGHARPGRVPPRRDQAQRGAAQLPRLRPGRDRLEPPGPRCSRSTDQQWMAEIVPTDDHLAPDGRVMEMLSEHQCEGWLEGYLLTGRHGLFSCYEAFIHIIDSMFNQHAKWLKVTRDIPWRRPIASLNYPAHLARLAAGPQRLQPPGSRASSTTWSTRRPRSSASTCRPTPTAALGDRPLPAQPRLRQRRSSPASSPSPQWLDMDAAVKHCTAGIGIWEWASNDQGGEPDVVMACAGDVPTLETLAAVELLREHIPELKIRVVNVVDLMTLQPTSEHPHGLSRPRLRRPLHHGQADHLRLPRLSLADPPPDLPPHQPRQPARARLQGRGHDHHAVRHGGAERPRPLPPGRRRDRPRAAARRPAPPTPSRPSATS